MTLLAPAALWLSIVGAAVVALYLLKIKRRRQTVPSLDFWLDLAGRTQVRSLFQQLKRWLSLALWLLIVACLMLAVGNPVFSLGSIKPQSIAIILDNSASMTTHEPQDDGKTKSRLTLAIEAINDMTARRPVADQWMLIEAGRTPRVLASWTMDRKAICDAAAAAMPRSGSGDLRAARELAEQLLAGKDRPTVVIVSDGANGQIESLTKNDSQIVYWPIGKSDDNLGITRLSARSNRDQAVHAVFASVVNASSKHIDTQLIYEIDGAASAVEPISIDPHGTWEKSITLQAAQGGVLRAWIDRPDALPVDNEAFAVLEPLAPASILLVTPPKESFFFEQALAAMDALVDAASSRTMRIEEYDAADAKQRQADLTIFSNCAPKHLPPRGQFVFANQWPTELPARIIGKLEHPELSMTQRDHPLCRYVNAAAVSLAAARRVDLPERATVLARAADGAPLIFLIEQPDRASLCLAFDVLESDLVFRNAFPLFLRNAVSYLVQRRDAWLLDQYHVGEPIEPLQQLPRNIQQITVATPIQPTPITLPVQHGSFLFDRTDRPGPLRFTIGDQSVYSAINLTDADESRNAPTKAAKPPQELLALSGRLWGAVPWVALATLATALIGFEWLTFNHRWTE